MKNVFAMIGAVALMVVTMGISVKMEDSPKYGISAPNATTVFRIDTANGEICKFRLNGQEFVLVSCFGRVDQ